MNETLQSYPDKRIGNWFLSYKSTITRLYKFVYQPYGLHVFLNLRVFSLEMIRQRLIVENEHFLSFRKSSNINFPWSIGPFVIKNKVVLQLIEILIRGMGFPTEAAINYDPHHIISNKRQANKNNPFENHEVETLLEAENWLD